MFTWIKKLFADPTPEEIVAKEKQVVEKACRKIDRAIQKWELNPFGNKVEVWVSALNNREYATVKGYCESIGWCIYHSFYDDHSLLNITPNIFRPINPPTGGSGLKV